MRVKVDENLPAAIAGDLRACGHDAATVFEQRMVGSDDSTLWQRCQQEGRFLVTQDLDFSDVRRFSPGSHRGLLLLRLRDAGRRALRERMRELLAANDITDWQGCFVVATRTKLRVLRAPAP